jgi:hypothetical protein
MLYRLLLLLIKIPLFSIASSAAVALAASGQTVLYPIDPMQRGTEIVNMFTALVNNPSLTPPYEVALQTTLLTQSNYRTYRYLVNGMIPFIQRIDPATNDTLLIVTYQLQQNAQGLPYFIVLPVEDVVAMLDFPTQNNLPLNSKPFTAVYPSGIIPYFSVDPVQRATDIVNVTNKLLNTPPLTIPYKTSSSQVWIQTNLVGPFNPNTPNGLLKNVTSISNTYSGSTTLIKIDYLPSYNLSYTLSVIVTPEQVLEIIFYDTNVP